MKERVKKEIEKILKMIQEARKYTEPFHPAKLFELCEKILAYQAWLIQPFLEAETAYRQKIVDFKNEEILEKEKITKRSNVEAESMAKTTEEYRDYKYINYVYELMTEQILLVKKFADKLEQEYKQ